MPPVRRVTLLSLALILLTHAAAGGPKTKPASQVLDVGTFRLEIAPEHNWVSRAKPELGCVLFQYSDQPALTVTATIGLFRLVTPPEARTGDRDQLAAAYATYDISGAQQALFKSNAQLMPLSKKPKEINGGQLLSFAEPLDAREIRARSTRFIRAWVFFPKTYAADGVLFLALGKQESTTDQVRPAELEKIGEIIAGIRDR